MVDCYRIMSEIMLQRDNLDTAENLIQQALDFINNTHAPDLYMAGYSYRVFARIYIKSGKIDQAKEAKSHAIECFQEIGLLHEAEKTERLLSEIQ